MAWYKITVNDNGGSGSSPASFYYHSSSPVGWYKTKSTGTSNIFYQLTTKPTRTYYEYNGHWTAKSGGQAVINKNGNTTSVYPLYSSDATIYAHWTRLSYTLTLDKSSGTGGTTTLYGKATEGGWYSNWKCTAAVSSVTPPTRSGYVFMGYYSGQQGTGSGFTKYINADGTFTEYGNALVLTANTTFYAWWKARREITVNANGGTGGTAKFYYVPTDGAFYADAACTNAITAITMPTKSAALSLGCFATDGTRVVAPDGTIADDYAPAADATIYAQWRTVVEIELDKQGGESGTSIIVYDSSDDSFHEQDTTAVLDGVVTPNKECHRFLGYFSQQSGGTKYINADGTFTDALYALQITSPFAVYAQWELVSFKATLDPGEGSADLLSFYCDGVAAAFYADDLLGGAPIESVPVPVRPGYGFTGYWNGEELAVSAAGEILCGAFSQDITLAAGWELGVFTLTFDYNGGGGSTQSKQVEYGAQIGTLPTATRTRATFLGWQVNAENITAATVYGWAGNVVAVANWDLEFGGVTDWFGLGNSSLVPIWSDAGDTVPNVRGSHTGRFDSSAFGGTWRNPSVRYMVCGDSALDITLGKAFAATYTGTGTNRRMSVSGFMIVAVRVVTQIGKFPVVEVSATANEGRDAINLFRFQCSVLARARAQNLMSAVTGGGEIQSCTLAASCDPVVLDENLMPCASDVVRGKLSVDARLYAPENEAPPTAGAGFALLGVPKQCGDRDYTAYEFTAEKEMA